MTDHDRVVVLCLANRCRSPMASAILVREAALAALPLDVVSAGFGEAGMGATTATIEQAHDLDLDLTDHRSRAIDAVTLRAADLIVGMERLHVREAVVLEPTIWPRAFTLRELVRRAEAGPVRAPDEPLRDWLAGLSDGRSRMDLMGASPDDDIADPTTDWTVDHATTAALLDDLVRRLVVRAWPA